MHVQQNIKISITSPTNIFVSGAKYLYTVLAVIKITETLITKLEIVQ